MKPTKRCPNARRTEEFGKDITKYRQTNMHINRKREQVRGREGESQHDFEYFQWL